MCKYSQAEPSSKTFREIELFAEKISKDFSFNLNKERIKDFAQRIGGEIMIADSLDEKTYNSGSLKVEEPEKFTITLSPITGILRDNFTIAHELGHYFLHSGVPYGTLKIRVPRWGNGLLEQQANRFAAALLMPESDFKGKASQYSNNPIILAGFFRVSITAAKVRLKLLNE